MNLKMRDENLKVSTYIFTSPSFLGPVEELLLMVGMEAVAVLFPLLTPSPGSLRVEAAFICHFIEAHRYFCTQSGRNLRPSYLQMTKHCSNFHFSIPPTLDSCFIDWSGRVALIHFTYKHIFSHCLFNVSIYLKCNHPPPFTSFKPTPPSFMTLWTCYAPHPILSW